MREASTHIRLKSRSAPVLALEPEAPISNWIERLDAHLVRSPNFFRGAPIVVDVSGLELSRPGVAALVDDLSRRGIRVMGLTGVQPTWASADLPPILRDCRAAGADKKNDKRKSNGSDEAARAKSAPLIVNSPVRSGQLISHLDGDVTIIGSVASGAEVVAGGSVHVYGVVRGKVMAGAQGQTQARIFCRRLEAELLAVGGVYVAADEMDANVRGQAIQAWLENETVKIARLG
jgi:septum site-determining protein MinC